MNKQPEIKAQTRQNLIDAFWSLYTNKRIEKITVKEITQKAGYNRSTFYEYFIDVYDMLEQIEQSLIPTLEEMPPLRFEERQIGMPIEAFLELYERNRKYYAVLLGENGDPAFVGKLKASVKPILRQAFGDAAKAEGETFEYMLEYVLSAMIGMMSFWLNREQPMDSKDLMALLSELTEKGVMQRLRTD